MIVLFRYILVLSEAHFIIPSGWRLNLESALSLELGFGQLHTIHRQGTVSLDLQHYTKGKWHLATVVASAF